MLAADDVCPFCAATERVLLTLLQRKPDVALVHCRRCHASSASRMPTSEALEKYYANYYGGKDEKITVDAPARIALHIYKHAKFAATRPEISILDYGGGDGSISVELAKFFVNQGIKKVSIALIDYDQSTPKSAGENIHVRRFSDLSEIEDQSMDIVIASAVIEHVPNPRPVIDKLFGVLKVGGGFYARTPHVFPLMKLASIVNAKFDFTYPAHVHDLGAKFWNNISDCLTGGGKYQIIRSTPSLVETSFQEHFLRTLAAYVLKIPGYVFKEQYALVGGWEVFIRRRS